MTSANSTNQTPQGIVKSMSVFRLRSTFQIHKKATFSVFLVTLLLALIIVYFFWQFGNYTSYSILKIDARQENAIGNTEYYRNIVTHPRVLQPVVLQIVLPRSVKRMAGKGNLQSVTVADDYQPGYYRVLNDSSTIRLQYASLMAPDRFTTLEELDITDHIHFSSNGLHLKMDKQFLKKQRPIRFKLHKKEDINRKLVQNIGVKVTDPRNAVIKISYTSSKPELSKMALDSILSTFKTFYADINNYSKNRELSLLEEEKIQAETQYAHIRDSLTAFYEKNMWVLNPSYYGQSIAETDRTIQEMSDHIRRLEKALGQMDTTSPGQEPLQEALTTINAIATQYSMDPAIEDDNQNPDSVWADTRQVVRRQKAKLQERISQLSRQKRNQTYAEKIRPLKNQQWDELKSKKNAAEQYYNELSQRYKEARLDQKMSRADVQIITAPFVPGRADALTVLFRKAGVALLAGLLCSLVFVLILTVFNRKVYSEDEVEYTINRPVLASIPTILTGNKTSSYALQDQQQLDPKLITSDYSPTLIGERYRSLRTRLLFNENKASYKKILIFSQNEGEGKSLTAGNLAIIYAQQKIPTILIDADLRRGVQHNAFACAKEPGLSNFLYSNADIIDKNIKNLIQKTVVPNLYVISSGKNIPNPSEILGSSRCRELFEFLSKKFGALIIDAPPISLTTDARILGQYADACILVVGRGMSNLGELRKFFAESDPFTKKVLGSLVNFADNNGNKRNTYSYYSY
ncbi:MAG: polysaccharide biosynthesis tyrosine autokinase [Caldithrix sp.]|nr:polysaccharide biosynthesis tyrosine autokinase [Caldithrix sp.]